MALTKEISKLEHSAVKLSITLDKDELKSRYDKIVKDFAKKVQLPGFRKGKAPVSVLEARLGVALKQDTFSQLTDDALQEVTGAEDFDKKLLPLPYSQPKPEKELFGEDGKTIPPLDQDFTYTLTWDVMPEFTVNTWQGMTVTVDTAEISEDDLARELKALQERNALVTDKPADQPAEKGDVAAIDYVELDAEGKPVEASKRDGYTFTIGESTGAYKFDDDILGMKTGDKKTVEKVFPTDGEDKENAGKALKFDLTIKSLKKRDLPELTDDFAQDVDEKFKTMDDLRAGIKDRMRKHLEDTEKALKINALYKALMEKNPVDIPESMIRIETESRYRSFAQRMGIDPSAMARSLTDADYERSRPEITNTVHSTLLMQKLLEQLQIEPSQADIDAEIKRVAGEAGQTEEEVRKYYVDENGQTNEYVKDEIRQRLLNDKLLAENTVNTGKTVSFDELLKEVHGGAN